MHVWTLHPKYLNRRELKACWQDGIKALRVLSEPKRYRRFYPGLSVFRTQSDPVLALARYLQEIAREGKRRGLDMDASLLPKIPKSFRLKIPVSEERLRIERVQLLKQLARLGRWHVREFESMQPGRIHPLFFLTPDDKPSTWEILSRARLSHR